MALIFLVEDRVVDIRPHFLEREGAAINGNIRDPSLVGLGESAFLAWIVEIGYARERARSQDLACVEGLVARIRTRNGNARECVTQPFGKVSLAQGVIPRVLVKNRGDDELDPVVFVDLIRELDANNICHILWRPRPNSG